MFFPKKAIIRIFCPIENCLYNDSCQQMDAIENNPGILDVLTHPVHIVNEERNLNPSAFIPFCQIGGKYFGEKIISHFHAPICTGFKKKIFEGQVCYSLNISTFDKLRFDNGRKNGLKLFIDLNKERESFLTVNITGPPQKENNNPINRDLKQRNAKIRKSTEINLAFDEKTEHEFQHEFDNIIKIHVNTVKPYTGYGSGKYIISSAKLMRTTSDFDKFPEAVKNCQMKETIEECANRKLLRGAANQCKCLPGIVNFKIY